MDKKILAISFFGSTKSQLMPFVNCDDFDVIDFRPDSLIQGIPGNIEDFKGLNIDYSKYYATIIWGDYLFPVIKYHLQNCFKHNILIVGNQHGVNKSIFQIYFTTPNYYCDFWNAEGNYMLDRLNLITNKKPLNKRWISLGSCKHEYLYQNLKWNASNTNGKVLIIHEPDLKVVEGDLYPHDSESIIESIIESCISLNLEVELKVHPNWSNSVSNFGEKIRVFNCNYVDISYESILGYSLVIGSRSSLLYECELMGVPVFAINSNSEWPDDEIGFIKHGIVKSYNLTALSYAIKYHYNKTIEINIKKFEYFSGPIGQVKINFITFLQRKSISYNRPSKKTFFIRRYYFHIGFFFNKILLIKPKFGLVILRVYNKIFSFV